MNVASRKVERRADDWIEFVLWGVGKCSRSAIPARICTISGRTRRSRDYTKSKEIAERYSMGEL